MSNPQRPGQPLANRLLPALCILIVITAILYLVQGFSDLLWRKDPIDLHDRWREQQYVLRHQNPFDVASLGNTLAQGSAPPTTPRDATIDPNIGFSKSPDYPPWAFFSGYLFFPLPWPMERIYFAALDLCALGFLAGWGFSLGRPFGTWPAILLASCVIAVDSVRYTLIFGQYGIIVVALLAAALILAEKSRPYLAGLILGVALLKPNISCPFILCFAARRQFKTIVVAIAYLILSSLDIWAMTKTNPFELIGQMMVYGRQWSIDRASLLKALVSVGVPIQQVIPLLAVACMLVACVLLWWKRHEPLLTLYAIVTPFAYVWTYHHAVDNLMILFPLLCLGQNALRSPTPLNVIAFIAVDISIWFPLGFAYKWTIWLALTAIWFCGLLVVLIEASSKPPASRRAA